MRRFFVWLGCSFLVVCLVAPSPASAAVIDVSGRAPCYHLTNSTSWANCSDRYYLGNITPGTYQLGNNVVISKIGSSLAGNSLLMALRFPWRGEFRLASQGQCSQNAALAVQVQASCSLVSMQTDGTFFGFRSKNWTGPGDWTGTAVVPGGTATTGWRLVQVVFAASETRYYVNGVLTGTGPAWIVPTGADPYVGTNPWFGPSDIAGDGAAISWKYVAIASGETALSPTEANDLLATIGGTGYTLTTTTTTAGPTTTTTTTTTLEPTTTTTTVAPLAVLGEAPPVRWSDVGGVSTGLLGMAVQIVLPALVVGGGVMRLLRAPAGLDD